MGGAEKTDIPSFMNLKKSSARADSITVLEGCFFFGMGQIAKGSEKQEQSKGVKRTRQGGQQKQVLATRKQGVQTTRSGSKETRWGMWG